MSLSDQIPRGLYWQKAWSLIEGCSPVSKGCLNCWSASQAYIRSHQKNAKIRARYEGLAEIRNGRPMFNGQIRLMWDDLEKPLQIKKPTVWSIWNDFLLAPPIFIDAAFDIMGMCPEHTLKSNTPRKPLGALTKKDYLRTCINFNGHKTCLMIHRIVWVAANGPLPFGFQVDHGKLGKQDNRLSNLDAVSGLENMQRAARNGLTNGGWKDGPRNPRTGRFIGKKAGGRFLDGREWNELPPRQLIFSPSFIPRGNKGGRKYERSSNSISEATPSRN